MGWLSHHLRLASCQPCCSSTFVGSAVGRQKPLGSSASSFMSFVMAAHPHEPTSGAFRSQCPRVATIPSAIWKAPLPKMCRVPTSSRRNPYAPPAKDRPESRAPPLRPRHWNPDLPANLFFLEARLRMRRQTDCRPPAFPPTRPQRRRAQIPRLQRPLPAPVLDSATRTHHSGDKLRPTRSQESLPENCRSRSLPFRPRDSPTSPLARP